MIAREKYSVFAYLLSLFCVLRQRSFISLCEWFHEHLSEPFEFGCLCLDFREREGEAGLFGRVFAAVATPW